MWGSQHRAGLADLESEGLGRVLASLQLWITGTQLNLHWLNCEVRAVVPTSPGDCDSGMRCM